jgi:hypothetical protein
MPKQRIEAYAPPDACRPGAPRQRSGIRSGSPPSTLRTPPRREPKAAADLTRQTTSRCGGCAPQGASAFCRVYKKAPESAPTSRKRRSWPEPPLPMMLTNPRRVRSLIIGIASAFLLARWGQLMASSGPFYRPDKTSETADRTSLKAAKRSPRAASVPKLSGVNIYHLRLMTGIAISTLIQRFRDPERRWV